jgi:tetratricopeptide (TPR) repeat protein
LRLAHQNLGSLLARMDRAEESLAAIARAESLGASGFELSFSRGMTLTLLYRLPEAEQAFAHAVSLRPRHVDAQLNLARLRYMRGDADFTRGILAAISAHPADQALQSLLASVLQRAGKLHEAEMQLRKALQQHGPCRNCAIFWHRSCARWIACPRPRPRPWRRLLSCPMTPPASRIWFRFCSRAADPRTRCRSFSGNARATHWGRAGLPTKRRRHDCSARRCTKSSSTTRGFVRQYRIEAPRGWSSMAELNAALGAALYARHRFNSHPLDQTLRHGSQTTRNLVTDPDPAIRAILSAFDEPIRMYLQELAMMRCIR